MIPLGLKETKEIDFRDPFRDFVAEHYGEDADAYDDAIAEFMDVRQAMRTPSRWDIDRTVLIHFQNVLSSFFNGLWTNKKVNV